MLKRLFSYFLQGLLYIAPIGLTVYIIYWAFTVVDGFIQKVLQTMVHFSIPGLGIIAIFFFLALLGFLGQTLIASPIKKLFSRIMERTPIIKVIYSALRDLFSAFTGKEKKFNKPVLVSVS